MFPSPLTHTILNCIFKALCVGHCGGLDNPTHYVRVTDFVDWIQAYVPKEELCFV